MQVVRITNAAEAKRLVAASVKAAPGKLAQLNPHLNLNRLTPGAVLIVPEDAAHADLPGAKDAAIAAEAMRSFITMAEQALDAATQRMKAGAERAARDESALASASKSKAVQAAIKKDPDLGKLLDGALGQAKEDSQVSAKAIDGLAVLSKGALAELEMLAKRLG